MDTPLFIGASLVTALALAKLIQFARWKPGRATSQATGNRLWTYTGQQFPIVFTLTDGTEVTTSIRNYDRGGLPPPGKQFRIRYNPANPTQIIRTTTLIYLAIAIVFTVNSAMTAFNL